MPSKRAPAEMFLPFVESKILSDEQGTFEGYLSVKNNIDLGNDRVKDGAFTKTIQSWGAKFIQQKWMPFLWQHDPTKPIGGITELREDAKGLYIKGFFDLDIQQGQEAYSGFKKGYLSGLSMGYETIKKAFDGQIRDLLEVKLWEGSAATFPMNEEAGTTSVKAIGTMEGLGFSYEDILWVLGQAVAEIERYPDEWDTDWMRPRYWKTATYSTAVIVEDSKSAGQLYKVPYTLTDDGMITLGDMEPVQIAYVTMAKAIEQLKKQGLSEAEAKDLIRILSLRSEGKAGWDALLRNIAEGKAGRRNSANDLTNIHSAMKAMMGLMDSGDMSPMMDHMSTLMNPEHLGPCMTKMAVRLDDTQRAALLSALQGSEPGDKSASAPGAAAAVNHPEGTKGAHSPTGAADANTTAIARMATEALALLSKAAGAPSSTTDPAAEVKALLAKAAGN